MLYMYCPVLAFIITHVAGIIISMLLTEKLKPNKVNKKFP